MKYYLLAGSILLYSCSKLANNGPANANNPSTPNNSATQERKLLVESPDTLYVETHIDEYAWAVVTTPSYKAYDEYGQDITSQVTVSGNCTKSPVEAYWRYQMFTFSLPDPGKPDIRDTVYVRLVAHDKPPFRQETITQLVEIFENGVKVAMTEMSMKVFLYENSNKTAEIQFFGDFPFASDDFKVLARYNQVSTNDYSLEVKQMERRIKAGNNEEHYRCEASPAFIGMSPDITGKMVMYGYMRVDKSIFMPDNSNIGVYSKTYSFK